jgi:uncharacterized protein (TIGR03083 family)
MRDMSATTIDARSALVAENARFVEVVRTSDPAMPVPTCPGWTLTQLYRHVGRGHRWAAEMVRTHATQALNPRDVPNGRPPDDLEGTLDWFVESAQEVLDAVDETGADSPTWTFVGPRPAGWWVRRRLHEETVHRADAQLALGVLPDLHADLAADGLSEWLDLVALRRGAILLAEGTSLHLHAAEDELGPAGEWTVRAEPDGIAWEHGHEKATVGLRGPATALFLATVRRLPADDPHLEVHGDDTVWRAWLEATPF